MRRACSGGGGGGSYLHECSEQIYESNFVQSLVYVYIYKENALYQTIYIKLLYSYMYIHYICMIR